jgi:hypothetical protein
MLRVSLIDAAFGSCRPGAGPGFPIFRPTVAMTLSIPSGEHWGRDHDAPEPVVVVRIGWIVPVAIRTTHVPLIIVPGAAPQDQMTRPPQKEPSPVRIARMFQPRSQ